MICPESIVRASFVKVGRDIFAGVHAVVTKNRQEPIARGIPARRKFLADEIIEQAPVIPLPSHEWECLEKTSLANACCRWDESMACTFGLAPLYRRTSSPNARLIRKISDQLVEIVALRDIEFEEEIELSECDPHDGRPIWYVRQDSGRKPAPSGRISGIYAIRGRSDSIEPRRCVILPLTHESLLETLSIPGGEFLMGSAENDPEARFSEKPQFMQKTRDYLIGRFPVTSSQFASFAEATGYRTTAEREGSAWVFNGRNWERIREANWRHPRGPDGTYPSGGGGDLAGCSKSFEQVKADHPVTQVSWDDAVAFCLWASKVTGRLIRLPSEPEWEKAARGNDGRWWPWGNLAPHAGFCNFGGLENDTTSVGAFSPQSDSPYGVADMSGNVWEWTRSSFRYFSDNIFYGSGCQGRVTKGGGFHLNPCRIRCAYRIGLPPNECTNCGGFRVSAPQVLCNDEVENDPD